MSEEEVKRNPSDAKKRILAQNKLVEADRGRATDARKRFLGALTEILEHFTQKSSTPSKKGRKKAESAASTPNKRGRKAESEEDKELLEDAEVEPVDLKYVRESPSWVCNGKMRSYQVDALNWMLQLYENGVNGILADEMGLGKTLMTISLLGYMKNVLGKSGPHLVIVPKSTLANWQKEFTRWCPSLNVFIFHGDKEKRADLKSNALVPGEFDCVITSYEMVLAEVSALTKFSWRYLVIDEAHRIKHLFEGQKGAENFHVACRNESSKLAETVRLFKTNNRLLLTGTPLQNNLHELWALLNFLMPDLFHDSNNFDSWFQQVEGKKQDETQDVVSRLHKILKPFLLRRVKADVEKELLPKKEIKVFVGLSPLQKEWYKKVLLKDIEAVNGVAGGTGAKTRLLNIAMQLRKVCNHPYLFQGVEPGPPYEEGEHLVTASCKLVVLDKLLKKLQLNGSRVLIFSQMTRMLDILEDFLALRGYNFCRLDGQTGQEERELEIEAFNAPNSEKFCFLLSTRAGGLGINLATADSVVLFDSDWNPQMDLQAMDRAHRIGQKKQVMVYRLTVQDTIEQKIVERAEAKLYLDALVIQQGRLVEKHQNASGDELLQMVKFGADSIFQGDADYQLTDADIDEIIALGQKKTDEFSEKLKSANMTLASFDTETALKQSLYEHGGIDFSKENKTRHLLQTWIAPPKRETKVANYSEQSYYARMLNPKQKERRKASGPSRAPGQPDARPHHFFPAKVYELFEQENAHFFAELELSGMEQRLAALTDEGEIATLKEEIEAKRSALPPALTPKQEEEKQALIEKGFPRWTKQHFQAFVRGLEYYGRNEIDDIAAEVGKDADEVRQYHKVFWERGKHLQDWDKIEARVQRGEAKRQKQAGLIQLLKTTFNVPNAMKTISITELVGLSNSRDWISQNDLWLLVQAHEVGYGNWERLKTRVLQAPEFCLDWFMLSRTPADLHERVDRLLNQILDRQKKKSQPKAAQPVSAGAPVPAAKKRPGPKKREPGTEAPSGSASKKKARVGPHKPVSAYVHFASDWRKERDAGVVASIGGFGDVQRAIAEDWKNASPDVKKRFEDIAAADKQRYLREKEEFEREHPELVEEKKKKSPKKKKEKSESDPPKQGRPASVIFDSENRERLKSAHPDASAAELKKMAADEWKKLSAEDKKVWLKKASEEKADYIKNMAAWRKKFPEEAAAFDKEKATKKTERSKKKEEASAKKSHLTQTTLDSTKKEEEATPTKKAKKEQETPTKKKTKKEDASPVKKDKGTSPAKKSKTE